MIQTLDELMAEANEVFYKWEEAAGITDNSDEDRIIFCIGYVMGKQKGELS